METKNREKMLMIAVVVAVGLLVLNYIVITPLTDSWKSRRDAIAKLRTDIQDGHDKIAIANSIQSRWEHMRTNTLPANTTIAENKLYVAFQGWEQASAVTVVRQQPTMMEPDDQEAPFKNEEFHVDVTGNLNQIFNFLYKMESSPLGLKVSSAELSSRDEQGRQLALGLTVDGLILINTNSASK